MLLVAVINCKQNTWTNFLDLSFVYHHSLVFVHNFSLYLFFLLFVHFLSFFISFYIYIIATFHLDNYVVSHPPYGLFVLSTINSNICLGFPLLSDLKLAPGCGMHRNARGWHDEYGYKWWWRYVPRWCSKDILCRFPLWLIRFTWHNLEKQWWFVKEIFFVWSFKAFL